MRLGFDAAAVARVEKSLQRASFAARVYGPREQALLAQKKNPAATAAANFAAKEALSKALRCGIFGFDLREAEVLRRADGSPYFAFAGALAQRLAQSGLAAEVSLSHEGGMAFACVLLQPAQKERPQSKKDD